MKSRQPFVVLGVTGSIAAYKACDIAGLLVKGGVETQVIMTAEARQFIAPLTLQTLSRNPVLSDMFAAPEEWDVRHVSVAKRADAVLIAPATAAIIGKLACGIYDDLLTCVVSAADAPLFIAPAMNDRMYRQPAVQENIARLKKSGARFIGPVAGRLACGDEAMGRLADVADIVRATTKALR